MKLSRIFGFSFQDAKESAHEVHKKTIAYDQTGHGRHVIFKKNKHPGVRGQEASKLEASFTAVANAYAAPHRALRQDIVTDSQGGIVGVCTENAGHALLRLRKNDKNIVFMKAPGLLPKGEVSEEDFAQWIKGHTAIEEKVAVKNKWEAIALKRVYQDKTQKLEEAYKKRLEEYWDERKKLGEYKNIDPKDLDVAVMFCNEQLDQGIIRFDAQKIPQKLKPILEPMSTHLQVIFEAEKLRRKCQELKTKAENIKLEAEMETYGVGEGVNFQDKLPQNFFARLLEQKKRGAIDIDMDSLADVFTTAYGLEEDDLHKGNIGYYVTYENSRPCFHFFKIDHDLMFSDKIMAARDARFANLRYSSDKFRITTRDLLGFPDLQDSGNHYWPTKRAIISTGTKAYHNEEDRAAYKSLKDDPEFQKAKWMRFLKQAAMPQSFISKCLHQPLDEVGSDPETESTLTIVQRASSSKIAELRVALLAIPEFREYLHHNYEEASKSILTELHQHCIAINCSPNEIKRYQMEARKMLKSIQEACEKNTPALHAAIQTQSYRCYETPKYFKGILNNKDSEGNTALDFAIANFEKYAEKLKNPGIARSALGPYYVQMKVYYADVICDLHHHKAKHGLSADEYALVIAQAQKTSSASILIPKVYSLADYKHFLSKMREEPLRTLKQDKVYAVKLLEKADLSMEELLRLREELKGKEPAGHLKFIKELRSEIWIIKKIRGVYGETDTVAAIKKCIDQKLESLQNKAQDDPQALSVCPVMS
ncbi:MULTISPECIES: hypothetical protein [Legionella]|uniref:Coiled-coil protein n=1 Tax=Legionella resiliens TaxID=2905958 RepID=A0ABS8X2F2_9GAMM|nr:MULTISPECIES: hypothetical protein [unclassified Legionella]MCE0721950.1 hypothetical protein [Legionella sp. 9fVS26]MCE3531104.1 hypothetical protein [Legionella sp. 8cVS16]QLZ70692.1 hypothetical protein FOLKNPGA_03509 [Legionella sp. PC1000]